MGRIEPCGGDGPVCCFGMFRVRMGGQWLGVFYISPRDSAPRAAVLAGGTLMPVVVVTYAWWQCCVFRYWIGHEHILLGSTLTPGGSLSAHCNL